MRKTLFPLSEVISRLRSHFGQPNTPNINEPLALILYENIGYLVEDHIRDLAFAALKRKVGLNATDILSVSMEKLVQITRLGGIHPEQRAARLKEIAKIALNDFQGDLRPALQLPLAQAIKALRKFPAIGTPGAEKILLFTKSYPVLALESNGLRVLLRLGFGNERPNYAASYNSVQAAIKDKLGDDCDFLIAAHLLLRRHGRELCRNHGPACEVCPLKSKCRYYRESTTPGTTQLQALKRSIG